MRKLIIILLFITTVLQAQNSVSVSLQPCDMGIGVRYDRQNGKTGFYTSVSHGNYSFENGYIKDHNKVTAGISYKNFTAGLNYHSYGEVKGEYNNGLKPVSFELGAKTHYNLFFAAIRFDMIKGEGVIDIGLNF